MAKDELKTLAGWYESDCGSFEAYCKPGELVDEDMVDYFLNILPPRAMRAGYIQAGEPYSTAMDPETNKTSGTYITFAKVRKGVWEYKGHCFPNKDVNVEKYSEIPCCRVGD